MPEMTIPADFSAIPFTSPTQQTKRTECCVLGTPATPELRYLILSTSPVLTTGDTSSTTTTELILRILRDILMSPGIPSVKWKYTVRSMQILLLCIKAHVKHRKWIYLKYWNWKNLQDDFNWIFVMCVSNTWMYSTQTIRQTAETFHFMIVWMSIVNID